MLNRFNGPTNWLTLTCLLVALLITSYGPAQAQTPTGTIAYVRTGGESGDQIRLIEPDGSNDREIWRVPVDDPNNIFEILSLAWRPDANELAFSSDHEHACSIFGSDLYAVNPSGSDYRRVGNGPACEELGDLPQGGVTVTVRNFTSRLDTNYFIYVQGAPGIRGVIIPHNGSATVTFPDVADFGDVEQEVVVIQAADRWEVAFVDVQPGQVVTATPNPANLSSNEGIRDYGAWGPTWRSDGSRIGFARSAALCLSVYSMPANNPPLGTKGDPVLVTDNNDYAPCSMAWAPTAAMASKVLYLAFPNLGVEGATLFLASEGDNASSGQKLFALEPTELLIWFDWVPDGQSFLFARTTKFGTVSFVESNLFEYNLASGAITQITNLTDEVVRSFSVSPDGQQIVFERAASLASATSELWLINRDGSNLRLLIEDGRIPNWSFKKPSGPPINPPQLYLPGIQR